MDAIFVTKNKLINADGKNRFQGFCSFYSGNDTMRYKGRPRSPLKYAALNVNLLFVRISTFPKMAGDVGSSGDGQWVGVRACSQVFVCLACDNKQQQQQQQQQGGGSQMSMHNKNTTATTGAGKATAAAQQLRSSLLSSGV